MLCTSGTSIAQNIQLPLLFAGDLLLVSAEIDHQCGWLILDTGAPGLVLNGAHFRAARSGRAEEALVDVHGQHFVPNWKSVREVQLGTLHLEGHDQARVLDLGNLEDLKGEKILGLLGWSVLKDYAWMLDLKAETLHLFSLDRRGKLVESIPTYPPVDSVDLHFIQHMPFVRARLGAKTVDLGLDTGAEVNLWCRPTSKWVHRHFLAKDTLLLQGFGAKRSKVPYGHLQPLLIGKMDYSETHFIVPEKRSFGQQSNMGPIDGILGIPFLRNRRMMINFRVKKIYFWDPPEPLKLEMPSSQSHP